MSRTKADSTSSLENEKNKEDVVTNGSEDVTTDNENKKKTEKKKEYKFSDEDDVKIISKKRAGKSITGNSLNVITFDENGMATCKGFEARYLLDSGLGFSLAK